MDGLRRRFQLNFHNHARDSHMLLEVSMPRHNTGPTRLAAQAPSKVKVGAPSATGLPPANMWGAAPVGQSWQAGGLLGWWHGGGARAETEASGGTRLWQGGHAFLSDTHEERAQRCCAAVGVCIPLRVYGAMGRCWGARVACVCVCVRVRVRVRVCACACVCGCACV